MAKKKKWTPQQRAKFIATMKARRSAVQTPKVATVQRPQGSRETIVLLQQGEASIFKDIRDGKIKHLRRDQILSLLVLDDLRGSS
jgi:hypothetical protein